MSTKRDEYLKRLQAWGYEPNTDGMDEADFDYVPPSSQNREEGPLFPEIRPGVDRDFAERMFKMFARSFDPKWQMPDLDGPEYIKRPQPGPGFDPDNPGEFQRLPYTLGENRDTENWLKPKPYKPGNEQIVPLGYGLGGDGTGAGLKPMSGKVSGGGPSGDYVTEQKLQTKYQGPNPPNTQLQDGFPSHLKTGASRQDGQQNSNADTGLAEYLRRLGKAESEGSGDYKAKNQFGHLGKYQMSDWALADAGMYHDYLEDGAPKVYGGNEFQGTWTDKAKKYGVTSADDFRNNPEAQEAAIREYTKKNWDYLRNGGYDKYIGKEIHGIKVTASGLLAACHLGGIDRMPQLFGKPGKYKTDTRGVPIDGNGKPMDDYLRDMGGLDMTGSLGYNPDRD